MFDIATFYSGKSIFITGGTGFLGKILVYKLLKSCPGVEAIYLLIRPKRGVEPQDRLENLFSDSVFDVLRERKLLRKVRAVSGDVTLAKLGMSDEDEAEIKGKVSVIFHSAATVKFDEDLTKSVAMNVGGTKHIMDLAKKLARLSAVVHVSTAYCNCDSPTITEHFYPLDANPLSILEECLAPGAAERMDTAEFTRQMVGRRPNTYTFTKALAEKLVREEGEGMPVAIVRPSIVVAALEEPAPGWIDNLNGPTGIIVGAGMGLVRTLYAKRDKKADFMPVDLVINTLCAVGAKVGSDGPNASPDEIPILNCTSGAKNPLLWGSVEQTVTDNVRDYPLEEALFYPEGGFKESMLEDRVCQILLHFFPAYLLDFVTMVAGGKPKLVKIYKKMRKATSALEAFLTNEWEWTNDNVDEMSKLMTKSDSIDFNLDVMRIDWNDFMRSYVLGSRHYLMKNKPDTIKASRANLERLRKRDMFIRCALAFVFSLTLLYVLF